MSNQAIVEAIIAGIGSADTANEQTVEILALLDKAGFVMVPKAALAWLFGEGPAPDGNWFSDDEDTEDHTPRKYPRKYWWRSRFRSMLPNGERS